MQTNTHTIDRVIRIAAGGTLLALAATGTVGLWGYAGVILLGTGLVGFCPLYTVLGISTCKLPAAKG
jgi:hypothetical protein